MKSGLLLINKPVDFTSRDVINKLVHKFHFKKIGHSGTLDPFADGLLLVLTANATKLVPFLDSLSKTYVATLKLGEQTDTGDFTGEIINKSEKIIFGEDEVKNCLEKFKGKIKQIPPMYSAIRVNGRKLYQYARNNEEVERKERDAEIYDIKLLAIDKNMIEFECTVSKGTYIRTLGEDIAKALGTYGCLTKLKRTKIGGYLLEDAKTFETVSEDDLIDINKISLSLPEYKLSNSIKRIVYNGQLVNFNAPEDEILFVDDDGIVAVYERLDNDTFKCKRGLR